MRTERSRHSPRSRRRSAGRLGLEPLEERNLLAAIAVTAVADSAPDAGFALGRAIRLAETTESSEATRGIEGRSISGTKFQDLTGDGFSHDDPPLPGTTIELYRFTTGGNGPKILGGLGMIGRVDSTVTAEDGSYSFDKLDPAIFFVAEVIDDGWMQTDGGNQGNSYYEIDLSIETEIILSTGNDFANAALPKLSGVLWDDLNLDNIIDDDENRLVDWTVIVTDSNGDQFQTSTDEFGRYSVQVVPGRYGVSEVLQPGWEQTYPLGRFQTTKPIPAGVVAGGVLLADVVDPPCSSECSATGLADLIILNEVDAPNSNSGSLWIYPNLGDRLFEMNTGAAMRIDLGATARPRAVVSADFDDDGDLDLAVAAIGRRRTGDGPAGGVIVLRNEQGVFSVTNELNVGDSPSQWNADGPIDLVAADLDNDGTLDLATVDFRSNTVSVLHGMGDGRFEVDQVITSSGLAPRAIDAADLDRDGDVELIVAFYDSNQVVVMEADQAGQYEVVRRWSVTQPTDVTVGDLDGDELPDLVVAGAEGVTVIWNDADGLTESSRLIRNRRARSAALGDVNGDGAIDVIVTNPDQSEIGVVWNLGRREFGSSHAFLVSATNSLAGISPQTIAVADLDGDQDQDLATGLAVGGASVLLNRQGEYDRAVSYGEPAEDLNFGHRFVGAVDDSMINDEPQQDRIQISKAEDVGRSDVLQAEVARVAGTSSEIATIANDSETNLDVNLDGYISPIDALLIVNRLNDPTAAFDRLFDVNGDGFSSPLDALLVINRLNQPLNDRLTEVAEALDATVGEKARGQTAASSSQLADTLFAIEDWLKPRSIDSKKLAALRRTTGRCCSQSV